MLIYGSLGPPRKMECILTEEATYMCVVDADSRVGNVRLPFFYVVLSHNFALLQLLTIHPIHLLRAVSMHALLVNNDDERANEKFELCSKVQMVRAHCFSALTIIDT